MKTKTFFLMIWVLAFLPVHIMGVILSYRSSFDLFIGMLINTIIMGIVELYLIINHKS